MAALASETEKKLPFWKTIRIRLLLIVLITMLPAFGMIFFTGEEHTGCGLMLIGLPFIIAGSAVWFLGNVLIVKRFENLLSSDSFAYVTEPAHITKNISDYKPSEKATTIDGGRFQTLVDNAPFGMMLIDKSQTAVAYVNPYFKNFSGYGKEDLPDLKSWFEKAYPDPEFRKRVVASWREDVKDAIFGLRRQRVYPIVCMDGSVKEANFTNVFFAGGEILICAEDVTKRRVLEEQLILARKMEAIGTLAGGIAHDFNNILMAILGYCSVILIDTDPEDPTYERLKIIEEQVHSAARLTRQLLGFARGGKYDIRTMDMNELLSRSAEAFCSGKEEIRMHLNLWRELWTVDADRAQIEQVFANIYLNAWQAMPEGGDLFIETRNIYLEEHLAGVLLLDSGKYICITVTDTGIGMDKTTLQKIFEPFFTTRGMGGGAGLGLASAYGVIKNHGGTIQATSEKGKGATFKVYLPASGKEAPGARVSDSTLIKGTETVLFVDDQAEVASIGAEMLQSLGYTVLVATSGNQAIKIFEKEYGNIDLAILDMTMPAMSGVDTFKAMKNINPQVKVILSSGFSVDAETSKILESGCNGFLQKPYNLSDLSKKIREVLG